MKPKRRSMDVNTIANQLVERSGRAGMPLADFYSNDNLPPDDQRMYAKALAEELSADLKGEELPKIIRANPGVSEYMSAIGKKGGKIGGKRRLKTMTAEQRKKSAQKAAKARWNKKH